MAHKWPTMTLREAGVTLIDCDHRTPPAADSGYPYVAIPQLRHGQIDLSEVRRISRDNFLDWTRKAKPAENDVVLSRRCNPGETAFVPPDLEFALGQNLVLLRADGTKVYPPFLRWLARSPEWWRQVKKFMNAGAVFDSLKCADIPNFELPIPPIPRQRAISGVLSSLDDKIQLNRKMNETLEATSRATYSALFNSNKARRASGWMTLKGIDAFDLSGGGTPKTSVGEFWDGNIPWFSIADAPRETDVWVLDTQRKVTEAGLESCAAEVLPEGTTIVTARGTVGRLALVGTPMAMNQSCYAVRGRAPLGPSLTYFALRSILETLKRRSHGSIFDTITRDSFRGIDVQIPPPKLAADFELTIRPLFERIRSNLRQSRLFAATRDTLLPKLMAGEVG